MINLKKTFDFGGLKVELDIKSEITTEKAVEALEQRDFPATQYNINQLKQFFKKDLEVNDRFLVEIIHGDDSDLEENLLDLAFEENNGYDFEDHWED